MKTSDIVVGTDYAYVSRPTAYYKGARQRVRVLATGVRFTSGSGWRQRTYDNGVEVVFLGSNGRKPRGSTSDVVKPAHIESTWMEWLERVERGNEYERQMEEHRFKVAAHHMRVNGHLALLGLKQRRWPEDGDYSVRNSDFVLNADEMLRLLTVVSEAGVPVPHEKVVATARKVRGENRYQILVAGIPVDDDHYSQDEAKAYAKAINEGVKPDAEDE